MRFLYTGENPIQVGVGADTLRPQTVAVIRGCVRDRDGAPLAGVQISILNRPEFGRTATSADGQFTIAVNGGNTLVVDFQKPGFLPAQRTLQVPWREYVWADDVALIPLDANVTRIEMGATEVQVARGSPVADEDGARRATLLVPAGTTAELVLADGRRTPLTAASIRATEYTVGENGPEAMPGTLPAQSGYTYALEYSVDEALAVGAVDVQFNQPVYHYAENFLDFPIGMVVPSGYYDRSEGRWVASDNGQVVRIVSIADGFANLDTDGDGTADNAPTLGITDAERRQLATLYQAGQSLWRVPMTHFTPWDYNWPFGPGPRDIPPPNNDSPGPPPQERVDTPRNDDDNDDDDPCRQPGSIIECENQTLGEELRLIGTPYSLVYRSNRMPGRAAATGLRIPLTSDTPPQTLQRVDLTVEVAGQRVTRSFAPAPSLTADFAWDGLDGFGRPTQGVQAVTVQLDYVYRGVYHAPASFRRAFGVATGLPLSANRARQEIALGRQWRGGLGSWDAIAQGLGGWSIDVHHVYDPTSRTLYGGDGSRRTVQSIPPVIATIAGNGQSGGAGDGGPATEASFFFPAGLAVDAAGNIYISDSANRRVRRIDRNGVIANFAGLLSANEFGDGGPATAARLGDPQGLAIGPDGSLYIADSFLQRVRRVDPAGIITTVAGTGEFGFSGDGGRATEAKLNTPTGVAVDSNGVLYIADQLNHRIRRVTPDGIITTIAGTGSGSNSGDNGPATAAGVGNPKEVAVGPDDSVYIATGNVVRRVESDGIIRRVAGTGFVGFSGDGGPATAARLYGTGEMAFAPDGTLFVADTFNHRVRSISPNGIITTLAGSFSRGFGGDGGPAESPATQLYEPYFIAVGPDGSVYIADYWNQRIRRVASGLPGGGASNIIVPAEDGASIDVFDSRGRHLRTVDAYTGAVIRSFGYTSAGLLSSITDESGNRTTIERDAGGAVTAIVGPFGQRTALALNSNGYLSGVTNPAGERVSFGYSDLGLLTSMTDARGATATYRYDAGGRLIAAVDRAGAEQILVQSGGGSTQTVTHRDAEGRTTSYLVAVQGSGDRVRTNTFPDATRSSFVRTPGGVLRTTLSDGSAINVTETGDPRFGMLAPVEATRTISTPAGLRMGTLSERTVTLGNASHPLGLTSLTERTQVNNRAYQSTYNATTRTFELLTPAARTGSTSLDTQGRVLQESVAGLAALSYEYDDRGRVTAIHQGQGAERRSFSFSYNAQSYIERITDPLGQTAIFAYDAAGRVTQQTDPAGRLTTFAYDANGNLIGLTPPGRDQHRFTYTATDLTAAYTAPSVGGTTETSYSYNAAQELTQITQPGGRTLALAYDSAGRVASLTTARGVTTYAYNATTGQLTGITAPGGVGLGYTYDGFLLTRMTQSGPVAGQIGYTYDNNFRVTATSVNGGNTVALSYDDDSLLVGAGALTLTRNAQNGLLTGSSLGTTGESWTYNAFAEPTSYQASAGGTTVYSESYTRDKLGRIAQKVETIGGSATTYTYTYDASGRLTEVRANGALLEQYSYDVNGNRLSAIVRGATSNGTYDAQDRLLTYGGQSFTYLPSGELRTRVQGGQTTTYDYDFQGNLIGVSLPDGRQLGYLIDGQDRRVGKLVNGTLVQGFLYESQLRPIAELDGAGNVISRFVYATGVNVPDYMVRGGITYRLVRDQVGSVRLVVNAATGAIAQRLDYDSFGNVLLDTNPGFQPFGFAGGLYDRDTGLVRFGVRDYDPSVGRWTAKDPIGFGGGDSNLYIYTGNEPINFADPSGMIAPAVVLGPIVNTGIRLGVGQLARGLGRALGRHAARTGAQILANETSEEDEDAYDDEDKYEDVCKPNKRRNSNPEKNNRAGRPGDNTRANETAHAAQSEIERRLGRKLTPDQARRLHQDINRRGYDYKEIVEEGISLFK